MMQINLFQGSFFSNFETVQSFFNEDFCAYFGQELGSATQVGGCGQPSGPLTDGHMIMEPQNIGQKLGHFLPSKVMPRSRKEV